MLSLLPIPSVDLREDGAPRFHIFPNGQQDFHLWAEREAEGGVDPEFRIFLSSQLESGDLLLDLAPGVGFLALSVATAPGRAVQVITVSDDPVAASAIEGNARLAGVTIAALAWPQVEATGGLMAILGALPAGTRVVVRISAALADRHVAVLWPLCEAGQVSALLLDPHHTTEHGRAREGICRAVRLHPFTLAERDGELLLIPAKPGDETSAFIATPAAAQLSDQRSDMARRPTDLHRDPAVSPFHFLTPFCRTGYGIAGANLLDALVRLKADVAFHPLGPVDPAIVPVPSLRDLQARATTLPAGAPSVRMLQQFDLLSHVGTGPRIGFPIFELDRFYAQELVHLKAQDRLLVCSDWARTVLRGNGLVDIPIDVVPLGVDRRIFHEQVPGAPPEDDTVFIQIGKIEPRKGQLDLLAAFEKAFTPTDRVRLVLHCHNPFLKAADLEALVGPFRRSPLADKIDLHLEPLPSQRDVARAIQRAHCGVFCSRAEGWNLEALEVLSMGKPLIATDYSAHTEFLTPENTRLVEVDTLEPRGVGHWAAFGHRQQEQLVSHLRLVHQQRVDGSLAQNAAGIRTAMHYSWEHAARCLLRAVAAAC